MLLTTEIAYTQQYFNENISFLFASSDNNTYAYFFVHFSFLLIKYERLILPKISSIYYSKY